MAIVSPFADLVALLAFIICLIHRCGAGGYDAELYHPVILVPGFTCPNVEARLTDAYVPSVPRCGELKGKGWFPLWKNTTDLVRQDYVPCFEEQMRLIYDPTLNDYRNLPGVETRVPDFGSAHGFTSKNDSSRIPTCLARVREELELLGYRDGDTLFGAPYDPRHAPPLPGQPSQVYSDYFARVKDLVERASEKNQNKPVILVAHSFGGKVILGFVNSTPVAWRKKFIKHLVLVSPTPPEGFLGVLVSLTSGPSFLVPSVPPLLLRQMWRTFASTLLSLPSPMAFGHRPIVITNHKNYSAYDYKDFLTALGLNTEVVKRVLSMKLRIDPPMVPTTYLNGIGVKTPEQVVYRDGNFDMAPEKVYGDGDGTMNLFSVLAFVKELSRQQEASIPFKFVEIANATHFDIVVQEHSLKKVMDVILEANR
ncbi:lecithin-cholesterol acyltransferase-like 1 [Triticum urartu]|nr:lecithin-cholesterol acyltransferase-like 1 [Triticum urartu]